MGRSQLGGRWPCGGAADIRKPPLRLTAPCAPGLSPTLPQAPRAPVQSTFGCIPDTPRHVQIGWQHAERQPSTLENREHRHGLKCAAGYANGVSGVERVHGMATALQGSGNACKWPAMPGNDHTHIQRCYAIQSARPLERRAGQGAQHRTRAPTGHPLISAIPLPRSKGPARQCHARVQRWPSAPAIAPAGR